MVSANSEEQDALIRGFHGIPNAEKLNTMSFIELSSLFASCEIDSPKFLVVERELKRRISQDQARTNRPNILLGAGIAGFFTILGAVAGGFLKSCPSCQQVAPTAAMQQTEKGDLGVKPPIAVVAPVQPASRPASKPAPVQSNAQPSDAKP